MVRACTAFFFFLACLPIEVQAQATSQVPVQHERSLRAQVTLQNWDNGGELSRFVYLNATEIFPAAPVPRSGTVRELPVHLRPEIGNFVVDQQASKDILLCGFAQMREYRRLRQHGEPCREVVGLFYRELKFTNKSRPA